MFEAETLDATVDFLAALAGDGPALELGIGTGRVALPLAARGITVAGIDLSEEMVSRLRAKPGGDGIEVAIGDFATARVDGSFTLAFLVFNTIGNLTTQEAQLACFRNAAEHLAPGGHFLIELGVPGLRRLPPGERYVLFDMSSNHVGIDEYDVAIQRLVSHHYSRRENGSFEYASLPFRYVWPAELDLMAQLAGLELRERWSGWQREPFDEREHVARLGLAEAGLDQPAAVFLHELAVQLDPAAFPQVLDDVSVNRRLVRPAQVGEPVSDRDVHRAVDLLVEERVFHVARDAGVATDAELADPPRAVVAVQHLVQERLVRLGRRDDAAALEAQPDAVQLAPAENGRAFQSRRQAPKRKSANSPWPCLRPARGQASGTGSRPTAPRARASVQRRWIRGTRGGPASARRGPSRVFSGATTARIASQGSSR